MDYIGQFLYEHSLDHTFLDHAANYFNPLIEYFLSHSVSTEGNPKQPFFLGINGAQGSGKTTLSEYMVAYARSKGCYAICLSIDDFYLTKAERTQLAESVHPLFKTRGVPGTHNYELMASVLSELKAGKRPLLPSFNKGTDEPFTENTWSAPEQIPDLVVIEGWCWGAEPEMLASLENPVNELEALEDPKAIWRSYANSQLETCLCPLYRFIDTWVMLKSPSFDTVYRWRGEQEQYLKDKLLKAGEHLDGVMSDEEIKRFILHYQRITEHLLATLPKKADVVWELDEKREISGVSGSNATLVNLIKQGRTYA